MLHVIVLTQLHVNFDFIENMSSHVNFVEHELNVTQRFVQANFSLMCKILRETINLYAVFRK